MSPYQNIRLDLFCHRHHLLKDVVSLTVHVVLKNGHPTSERMQTSHANRVCMGLALGEAILCQISGDGILLSILRELETLISLPDAA